MPELPELSYQPDEEVRLEVRMEDETVWLTQAQMVELFNSSKQNISLHISNIYKEGELSQNSTVKEYLTVQKKGDALSNVKSFATILMSLFL